MSPYLGRDGEQTAGWSGSDTSADRAEREAVDGGATKRESTVLAYLSVIGEEGVTWGEFADYAGLHHGQASSALSNLHRKHLIVRLTEARGRSKIYVLPEHVNGRDTEPYGGHPKTVHATCPNCHHEFEVPR